MSPPAPPPFWTRVLAVLVPPSDRDHLIIELSDLYAIRHARWGRRAAVRWYRREALGFLVTRLLPSSWRRFPSPFSRPPIGGIMSDSARDVVRAIRSLARRPTFALIATTTIALGIGATTAVFGLANWLLLRPVPGVPHSDRLGVVMVTEDYENGGWSPRGLSYPNYKDLSEMTPAAEYLAGYWDGYSIHVAADGSEARTVTGSFVTWDYFDALGVRASEGRTFEPADESSDRMLTGVVISERLRQSLSGRTQVRNLIVNINGIETPVLGVVPEPFHGVDRLGDIDVWIPGAALSYVLHFDGPVLGVRDRTLFHWFLLRLAPDATFEQAQQQLRSGIAQLHADYPNLNVQLETATASVTPGIGTHPRRIAYARRVIVLLGAAVTLVLALACANVANLLLFRGVSRRGEVAVRRALGAPFSRMLRYELVDSLVLALAGAGMGIAVALTIFKVFEGANLVLIGQIENIAVDWRVLSFSICIAVLTSVVFGLVPGIIASRVDVATALHAARRSNTTRGSWLRQALTITQLALATTILVAAALLIGTLRTLARIDLGFNPQNVTTFHVSPQDQGYGAADFMSYHQQLEQQLTRIPGVTAAAATSSLPLWSRFLDDLVDPTEPADTVKTAVTAVGHAFFDVTQISLVAGRAFRREEIYEERSPIPVIASDSLARRIFGRQNPIGRTLLSPEYRAPPSEYIVVGVAANTRWDDLESQSGPVIFLPYQASPYRGSTSLYVVRSNLVSGQLEPLLREAAGSIDTKLPISYVRPLQFVVEQQTAEQRLLMRTLTILAIFAVLLAGIGLYGVVAFGVAERTREFGIRVALGANDRRVLGLVLRQAGAMAGIGVAIGLAGAAGFSQWLEIHLYGIEPLEPSIYVGAAFGLGLVAMLAGLPAARRATRVDPMTALRCD